MITEKSLVLGQKISSSTPYGLIVEVNITQTAEDKPLIYTYTYMLDTVKFKAWLEEHAYLCEGPLAWNARGIQVMAVGGAKKWDKSAFSVSTVDGTPIYLPLLRQEVTFSVHRDLFSGEEWEVMLDMTNLKDMEDDTVARLVVDGDNIPPY